MVTETVVAYLHFLSVLATGAVLTAELLLYRRGLTAAGAALLQRLDIWFGITAGAAVLTGLLRVFWVGKGMWFYLGNPLFHTLGGMFLVVGLVSIGPTVHFIRWGKAPRQGQAPVIGEQAFRRIHRMLLIEVHVYAIMPLLAVLMARGIGN